MLRGPQGQGESARPVAHRAYGSSAWPWTAFTIYIYHVINTSPQQAETCGQICLQHSWQCHHDGWWRLSFSPSPSLLPSRFLPSPWDTPLYATLFRTALRTALYCTPHCITLHSTLRSTLLYSAQPPALGPNQTSQLLVLLYRACCTDEDSQRLSLQPLHLLDSLWGGVRVLQPSGWRN